MAKIRQRRYRRITAREGGGVDDRFESRPRLPFAADSAVERAARIIRATDHRENVPALRIDRDERGLERGSMQPRESDRDGALCRVLDVGQERCVHLPFGRMIAAELTAELLPQKFFRPGRAGIAGLAELLDARLGQLRGALLAS